MPLFDKAGKGVLSLFAKEAPAKQAVNLSRRGILGIPKQPDALLPTVVPPPAVVPEAPPIIGALEKVVAAKMAKPTTRREFMEEGAKAAASTVARRVVPGALNQAVKQVVKAPPIDEAVAANKIADYLSSVYNDESIAALAYKIANKTDDVSDLSEDLMSSAWSEFKYADDIDWKQAAKTLRIDPRTIAAQTGLPVNLVRRLAGDSETLLGELAEASDIERSLYEILEDGRGKEAARSSSYLDVMNDEAFLSESLKKAMQDLGPDADDYDIISDVADIMRERFDAMQRGHQTYNSKTGFSEYTPPQNENTVSNALRKRVIRDDLLGDVWGQAHEIEEYDSHNVINEALEALRNVNTPKNQIDYKPFKEYSLKENALQALSWINNLEDSYSKDVYSELGLQPFMQHRFANTNSEFTKALSNQVSKRFDEIKSSNPDMPDNMQFELLRSELNFPAELLNVALNRVPRWPGVDHTIWPRGKADNLIASLKNEMPETDTQTIVDELFKRHGEAYKDQWVKDIARYSDFAKSKNELPFSPEDKMKVMTTYSGLPAEFIQSILKLTPE